MQYFLKEKKIMAGQFTPPPRVKTALDNRKLSLSAPCPSNPAKKSNLIWGIALGNPRITVYTGDAENSKITAALDIVVFEAFLLLMEKAIKAEPGWKDLVVNKNFTWFNRQRSPAPEVVSELHVGKDAEGSIWISVIDNKATKVRFFITPPEFHQFSQSKEEVSGLFTQSYVNILRRVMTGLFVDAWPEVEADYTKKAEEAKAKREGAGGGGYSKAPPAASMASNDIPW